jgi:inhibitor of cysteine peptidase
MLQLQKTQHGSDVRIRVGESLELQLPENPTTGYRWHLLGNENDVLQMRETTFQRSGDNLGAGGLRTWRLQAARVGTVVLDLAYRRPWEDRPVDTFRITVHVEDQ